MHDFFTKPFTIDRIARLVLGAFFIISLLYIIKLISGALVPFVIALIISYIIYPLVDFCKTKLRIRSHAVAVGLSLSTILLLLTGLLIWIIPQLIEESQKITSLAQKIVSESHPITDYLPPQVYKSLQEFIHSPDFEKKIAEQGQTLLPGIWGFLSGTMGFVFGIMGIFIVLSYTIFILLDYERMMFNWDRLIPENYRPLIVSLVTDVRDGMNAYFRAQLLIAFINAVLYSVALWIAGLPLSLLIGLLMGFLSIIPYLQILGLLPAVFLALAKALETGSSFEWEIIYLMIAYFSVQFIVDWILSPKIMGSLTGMNPAVMLYLSGAVCLVF